MAPPISSQMPQWWAPKKMARASGSGIQQPRLIQPGIIGEFITSSRVMSRMPLPLPNCEGLGAVEGDVDCIEIGHIDAASRGNKGKGKIDESFDSECTVVGEAIGHVKDVVIIDEALTQAASENFKKRKSREYELNRAFHDIWAIKFPWAESVLGASGKVSQVRCLVCTQVEGRLKLFAPKLDGLYKHAGRHRALNNTKVAGETVKAGEYYYLKSSLHIKNKAVYYMTKNKDSVVSQLASSSSIEKRKKIVQFTFLFYILFSGSSMLTYENAQRLFQQLRVPDTPAKHWSDTAGWEIADSMAKIVKLKTKSILAECRYFSVSCDEVTTIDTHTWLSTHVYVVKRFKRVPILLSLQRVSDGATTVHLYDLIVSDILFHGGLSEEQVAEKLLCFRADGDSVFQGCKKGVTTVLRQKSAPYCLGVHYVAHRTNLAAEKINNLPFVGKLEAMCSKLNSYFKSSSKRVVEFQKLAEELETGGNKLFMNVKTRWISLLPVFERIEEEFKTLVVQMYLDSACSDAPEKNYNSLCDISNLLALPCVLPLLRALNELSKFAQSRDVYICEYVASVKQAQMDLFEMYVDLAKHFSALHFQSFSDLVHDCSHTMSQEWVCDEATGVEHLKYRIGGHLYHTHLIHAVTNARCPVTREGFDHCVSQVKSQCTAAAELIISELDKRFPDHEQMDALGIVFPQFWLMENADEIFDQHLVVLQAQYGTVKSVMYGDQQTFPERHVTSPIDGKLLHMQQSFFKLTMKEHCESACEHPRTMNPLTKLWSKIHASQYLTSRLSEYEKLAEIACVIVIGSVEDKRTFSTVKWVKNQIRNRLTTHLDTAIRMFSQNYFSMTDFPYEDAYVHWKSAETRCGGTM